MSRTAAHAACPDAAPALAAAGGSAKRQGVYARHALVEPALAPAALAEEAHERQWAAMRSDEVPARVPRTAARITTVAVDGGTDLTEPDPAPKQSVAGSVVAGASGDDAPGHGTFVPFLAATRGSRVAAGPGPL